MSDLSITAANVRKVSGSTQTGTAGAAITAGEAIYLDKPSNTWLLAKSNSATMAAQQAGGIALNSAATEQPVVVLMPGGTLTVGATVTPGQIYVLSGANAGGIAPVTDLTSGWYTQIVLLGLTTTTATLVLEAAGVAVP